MTFEEKSAWVMGVVSVVGYTIYVSIVLGLAQSTPLTETAYVAPMLWVIGGSIVAAIVLNIILGMFSKSRRKDARDRQIYRFGEYTGNAFLVAGALAAMLMAMAQWDHFWIANVIYLGFMLSAVLATIAKVVAYRSGLPEW